jgi:recombination associated protein RdgC
MGKKLEQARIVINHNSYEYGFTLAAAMMEFRNVRLPKTAESEDDGKMGGNEALEGMLLERIYLFEQLVMLVHSLFSLFLSARLGAKWPEELMKIRRWVAQADHAGSLGQ